MGKSGNGDTLSYNITEEDKDVLNKKDDFEGMGVCVDDFVPIINDIAARLIVKIYSVDRNSYFDWNEEFFLSNSKYELLKSVTDFYYPKTYCDRGGSYEDRLCIGDKRMRNIVSRLIKLPFHIVGKKGVHGSWVLNAKNLTHNHEPSIYIYGHPSLCRLSLDDVQSVKNDTFSHTSEANSL
uniref:Uncharacterized protein n=1 Tax=Lactuca sativa TaxID=4236 RepID=A0A9R1VQT3_LACSA|nr:hypothetical protein LSAT_V11C400205330 [Lactuca sativa]